MFNDLQSTLTVELNGGSSSRKDLNKYSKASSKSSNKTARVRFTGCFQQGEAKFFVFFTFVILIMSPRKVWLLKFTNSPLARDERPFIGNIS